MISLDEIFTVKLTPNSNVNNFGYSSAYLELEFVEKVPEAGTVTGLSLLGLGGLIIKKKRSSAG